MERFEFNYSMKDIPIADKRTYMIKLFDQTNKFINRMRWRAFFFERRDKQKVETENVSKIFQNISKYL